MRCLSEDKSYTCMSSGAMCDTMQGVARSRRCHTAGTRTTRAASRHGCTSRAWTPSARCARPPCSRRVPSAAPTPLAIHPGCAPAAAAGRPVSVLGRAAACCHLSLRTVAR